MPRQLLDGHPVHTGRSLVGLHLCQCCIQVLWLKHLLHHCQKIRRALVPAGRDKRFDPPTGRVLGFTRHARRKAPLALLRLHILSPVVHLPPLTTCHSCRLGLGPRNPVLSTEGKRPSAFGRVIRTTTPSADFCRALSAPCETLSPDASGHATDLPR